MTKDLERIECKETGIYIGKYKDMLGYGIKIFTSNFLFGFAFRTTANKKDKYRIYFNKTKRN